MWAASRDKLAGPLGRSASSPHFRSVALIDGPATLAPYVGVDAQVCGKPVIVPFMGGTPAQRPGAYRQASPDSRLPLGIKQLYVLGELGPMMQPWIAQIRPAGDPVVTLAPTGANHFDIVTAGTANGEKVADWIKAEAF